jgi:hypothetical protein
MRPSTKPAAEVALGTAPETAFTPHHPSKRRMVPRSGCALLDVRLK